MFADEPTGNLDSSTSEEILKLLRAAVDDYGQTTVMVTHDARAAAIADQSLPRRRTDRARARQNHAGRGPGGDGRARPLATLVFKVAVKGLLGRKLRAALTATAIVLGVAMASGTFVLTDTINGAFNSIFSQSYKNADVVITGKTAFENLNGNGVQAPSFPETLLAEGPGAPGRGRPLRAPSRTTRRSSSGTTARRSAPAARPTSASASTRTTSDSTRCNSCRGRGLAAATRSRSTRAPAARSIRGRRHDRRREQGPGPGFPDRRDREAPRRGDRRRNDGRVRSPHGAGVFQRIGQLDVIRVQAKSGVPRPKLITRSSRCCRRRRRRVTPQRR